MSILDAEYKVDSQQVVSRRRKKRQVSGRWCQLDKKANAS
jgi:hypothetical protein